MEVHYKLKHVFLVVQSKQAMPHTNGFLSQAYHVEIRNKQKAENQQRRREEKLAKEEQRRQQELRSYKTLMQVSVSSMFIHVLLECIVPASICQI